MKRTYLILTIYIVNLCPLLAIQAETNIFYSSQEKIDENSTSNYLSEEGELLWQAVYDTDMSIEDIKKNLIERGDEYEVKDYAVSSKRGFKKGFIKNTAPLLNYDFVSMFTINNFNEDW